MPARSFASLNAANAVKQSLASRAVTRVNWERRRFWIPEKLAYKGAPGKPKGTLVFDVELVKITKE